MRGSAGPPKRSVEMLLRHRKTALKLLAFYIARKRNDLWRGALSGAIGGLAGSGIMKVGQKAFHKEEHNGQPSPQGVCEEGQDPAAKVAEGISEKVMGTELSPAGKKNGGALVHFAFGSGMGAVYGAISELAPATTRWAGAPFGAVLWAAADLGAMPAFGLIKPPHKIPLSRHAEMLGMHVAYGLTTDTVRRYVRRMLD
jgi:putative membrane protein